MTTTLYSSNGTPFATLARRSWGWIALDPAGREVRRFFLSDAPISYLAHETLRALGRA